LKFYIYIDFKNKCFAIFFFFCTIKCNIFQIRIFRTLFCGVAYSIFWKYLDFSECTSYLNGKKWDELRTGWESLQIDWEKRTVPKKSAVRSLVARGVQRFLFFYLLSVGCPAECLIKLWTWAKRMADNGNGHSALPNARQNTKTKNKTKKYNTNALSSHWVFVQSKFAWSDLIDLSSQKHTDRRYEYVPMSKKQKNLYAIVKTFIISTI